jgi:hypothetical protein
VLNTKPYYFDFYDFVDGQSYEAKTSQLNETSDHFIGISQFMESALQTASTVTGNKISDDSKITFKNFTVSESNESFIESTDFEMDENLERIKIKRVQSKIESGIFEATVFANFTYDDGTNSADFYFKS